MRGMIKGLLMAVLLGAAAQPAAAAVQYDFTAYSSFDLGTGATYNGDFTYVAPTYIVPDVAVPASALTSCAVFGSDNVPASCANQGFLNGATYNQPTTVIVSFGFTSPSLNAGIFYYFDAVAFSAPGTYQTVLFGTAQAGQLVVTDLAVPEPASWALMIAGFGLVGGALRQRRVAVAAA